MPDPFDEIRRITQSKLDELENQRQSKIKSDQEKETIVARFASELLKITPGIIEILNEFKSACLGNLDTHHQNIQFRNSGLSAIAIVDTKSGYENGKYFFRIDGDNSGNIKGFYLGTKREISSGDYSADKEVYENTVTLPPNSSHSTIKETLVKLYKKNN